MSRPPFTQKAELPQDAAIRTDSVSTETGTGSIAADGQSQLIDITSADHGGVIIESFAAANVSGVDPANIVASLWIGPDDGSLVTFDNARVYIPVHTSGGAADLAQPVSAKTDERIVLLIDNTSSSSASVSAGLVYRQGEY